MTTTDQNLADRLEELREKATPGPWSAARSDPAEGADVWWLCAGKGNAEKELGSLAGGYPHDKHEANAALIVELFENLDTIISALRTNADAGEGFVLVPREPTEEMQRAYFDSIDKHMRRVETDCAFGRFDNHRIAYRAMISAAPSEGERG